MGSALPQPLTDKSFEDGMDDAKCLAWGAASMQGWRISMEDAHFAVPSLNSEGWRDTAGFAVLDGHGGDQVARFCEQNLPEAICAGSPSEPDRALVDAFHRMDELLRAPDIQAQLDGLRISQAPQRRSLYGSDPKWIGCTAVVSLIRSDVVIVANAGDSRAVLCRAGEAVPLSSDHKPNHPVELERISKAGGTVERQQVGTVVQHRVNGNLNLSRSIGDLQYKRNALRPEEQMICSTPDVTVYTRTPEDEFIVLACDGVWDVLSNQDAVDLIRKQLPRAGLGPLLAAAHLSLSEIAGKVLDSCISPNLASTGGLGGDNMTLVIVALNCDSAAQSSSSLVQKFGEPSVHECEGRPLASRSLDLDSSAVSPLGLFCGCGAVGSAAAPDKSRVKAI